MRTNERLQHLQLNQYSVHPELGFKGVQGPPARAV